jgi:uncharacterized coiled-coil protein SlyX
MEDDLIVESDLDTATDEGADQIEQVDPPEDKSEEEVEFIGFADDAPKDGAPEDGDQWKGQEAPAWVKQTRQENRELKKRLRELESKNPPDAQKLPELGKKPTLAECEYDEDALQTKLDAWYEQKSKVDAAKAAAEAEQQKLQSRWNEKFAAYTTAKATLARDDYEEAESAVQEALTQTQIGILLDGTKTPAQLVYALGKSPAKLKTLQGLNPVETAFALARLEAQVQVNRKPKVSGESTVKGGTTPIGGGSSAKLAQLEAEAEKTGDRSKIHAYRQQLRTQK